MSSKNYIVCNRDGIPYRGQVYGEDGNEYGTIQECIEWINRDRKSLLSISLTPDDNDYIIKDSRNWRCI